MASTSYQEISDWWTPSATARALEVGLDALKTYDRRDEMVFVSTRLGRLYRPESVRAFRDRRMLAKATPKVAVASA